MKYTNAKFLHTLSAGIALGSLAVACGADAPPPPQNTGGAVANNSTSTTPGPTPTGPAVPVSPTGPAVPAGPTTPTAQGTTTAPPAATSNTTTPAPLPGASSAAPPAAASDRPVPGQPVPVMSSVAAPTATVAPTVTTPPVATPTTPAEEEEEDPAPMGGEGNALTASDALWISLASNGVGVEGSWYEFHDELAEDVELTAVDGVVCVSGTVAIKEDDSTYGAGMGLNLADEDEWDGSAYSGFSFTAEVTSDTPIEVRVLMPKLGDKGQGHFVTLKNGKNSIAWGDLEQQPWVAESGEDVAFDPSQIISLQFANPSVEDAANTFKVCISDLVVDE